MADISVLARLLNGAMRNVDLTNNTPVVLSIKVGGGVSNTELTKAILDRLVATQNGSDLDATYHTHDGRYFTEAELGSATASSGSDLIGDDDTYSNIAPTAATVKGALQGIDDALANVADEKVGVSANDTTPGYLEDKIVVDVGINSTNALEASTLNDGGDEDLRIRLDVSKIDHGALTGLGDDDHTIYTKADGTRAFTGDQSMGGNKLTNVGAPTASSDAATKQYVDSVAEGLRPKEAARAASTADIDLATGGLLTIDGVALSAGDRVLVKDQTDPAENGIYVAAAGAWSRATDFDSLSPIDEINGAMVAVQEGTTHAGKVFVQQGSVATLDTDDITFVFFNSNSTLVGGDGITVSGSNISVDHDGEGLTFNGSDQLALELDGATLAKGASGLKVASAGITEVELAASVAGAGLTGGAGSALAVNVEATDPSLQIVSDELGIKFDPAGALSKGAAGTKANVDDSTIEIATNALQVKDAGITLAKLAADSVDENKIVSTALGSTLSGGSGTVISVVSAPLAKKTMVAGEAFAANTSFLVRFALSGETAGRVYKADKDASSSDGFYAIGIALATGAVSAGQNIDVVMLGTHTLGASDATFGGTDIGKAVFLTSAGAFSVTAPSATNEAVVRIGMVEATDKIFVQGVQVVGVN